jgi:hypothetical protein
MKKVAVYIRVSTKHWVENYRGLFARLLEDELLEINV